MECIKGQSWFFFVSGGLLSETFQYRPDTSHELSWRKWFRYIVIRTELERSNLIVLAIACREYDDRCIACLTDFLTHSKTVFLWEIEIEDNEVELGSYYLEQLYRLLAIMSDTDFDLALSQIQRE